MEGITYKWSASFKEHFRYRWHTGMVAWLLHRITGLGITLYLGLHVWSISKIYGGPEKFEHAMNLYRQPIFKMLEIFLFGAVIYHTVNGMRLLWCDFLGGAKYHKKLFWGWSIAGAIIFVLGAYYMWGHIHW